MDFQLILQSSYESSASGPAEVSPQISGVYVKMIVHQNRDLAFQLVWGEEED